MNKRKPLLVLVSFPFLFGCVSLSEVHNYAASSVIALNKMSDIDYSFKDYCQQDCELQQLRIGEIRPSFNCTCEKPAADADEAIHKIHATIISYLQAIEQLSNNNGFSYDVSGLTAAVRKSTLLKLSDQQSANATKAGNFIARSATSFYRKKKLKQYLGEADSIFQDLTATFIYLIDNRLRAQLKFEYDARIPNIKQMVDNSGDKAMKQILIKLYLDEKAYYNKHNALIDTYVTLLKSVQNGYHELYLHRYNLKDQNTKEVMQHYSEDLQYIMSGVK
jgi:hypothetical protein